MIVGGACLEVDRLDSLESETGYLTLEPPAEWSKPLSATCSGQRLKCQGRWFVTSLDSRRTQCLVSGTGSADLRLKRPDRCLVRILRVYHARQGFSGERIRIGTPPIIIDSILTLISNGKTEVAYGNE